MRLSRLIMQRAFAGRTHVLGVKKTGKRAALVKKLRNHLKSFVVVRSVRSNGHTGLDQTSETPPGAASLPGGVVSQTCSAASIDGFIASHAEILILTPEGLQTGLATGCDKTALAAGIESLLRKALGPRVTSVAVKNFHHKGRDQLLMGLIYDQRSAYENVIRGPPANDPVLCPEFRKLWGNWSECRRFPDLSTCEAVYFPARTLAEKRNIAQTIVEHVLKEHFRIPAKHVVSLAPQVNQMLKPPLLPAETYGSGEEALARIVISLEELIKKMRQLKNLPLAITSMQGISAVFRGAEVWPPLSVTAETQKNAPASAFKQFLNVFEVVMTLESTGKWPDELNALRAVKFQFIDEICKQITKELGILCRQSPGSFDVFHEGYVFRVIPYVRKEVTLLRQVKSDTGVLIADISSSKEAEALHTQNDVLPKLTGALSGINTRFVVYNSSCRLAKRWVSSQFMHGYIEDLIIELLVAHTFLASEVAPSTPLSGFFRFLDLLSTFPFATEVLLVNLNQSFSARDVASVNKFYRTLDPKPSFFIVTPYDRRFGMFSKVRGSVNSPGVVHLLIDCAKKCKQALLQMLADPHENSIAPLFQHAVDKSHLIIHLKKKQLAIASTWAALSVCPNDSHPVLKYLKTLRGIYDDFAVFLFDPYGGSVITVYWKALTFQSKPLVKLPHSDKVLLEPFFNESDGMVTPHVEALIESFNCLGEGIVHRIEAKMMNWPV